MNWISKHSSEHKANLLKYNAVDDHASKGPHKNGEKLKNKINKLSDKHAGLYNAVVEGHGQNEYTSGNYDRDMKKLHRVEDKLKRKEEKYQEKFGDPYSDFSETGLKLINSLANKPMPYSGGPRMEGPLDKCAKSEGGSGCIKKVGGSWRVESNKTGKLWPAKYKSESSAKAGLRGYHAG